MADLHVTHAGTGPRIVLLHGFTQTGACWPLIADALAADHEVAAVDLPRHGGSASIGGDVPAIATMLAAALGPATWIGYSMGARIALAVAVEHPDAVDALVLVSGTAGIDDPAARAERRAADEQRAAALEDHGLEAFLDGWLDQPMFADVPEEHACREERAAGSAAALAASLREAGTGAMAPMWDRLASVSAPTLLLTGERDATYRAAADRLVAALGGPTTQRTIAGAGHAVHLVDPAAVLAEVRSWLASAL